MTTLPRLLACVLPVVAFAAPLCSVAADPGAPPAPASRNRLLFFTKCSGVEHDVVSYHSGQPSFAEKILTQLAEKEQWKLTFSKDGSKFSEKYLTQFDAVIFCTSGDLTTPGTDGQPPMTEGGKNALLDFVSGGRGFVGIHSAADTFHTLGEWQKGAERYKNFGLEADTFIRLLGGEQLKHGDLQRARLRCVDPKFPGLAKYSDGVELEEEWISLKDFNTNLHVLFAQETQGMAGSDYQRPPYPATWARSQSRGRVFYTSLGHGEAVWSSEVFQDILSSGIRWALGQVKADVTPNLSTATPGWMTNPIYQPRNRGPAPAR